MSRSLRYRRPEIQDHLASQYVVGTLSTRCRKRLETLAEQIPELENRIYHWQQRMTPINDALAEATPPKKVWKQLNQLSRSEDQSRSFTTVIWQAINVWRAATGMALLALLITVYLPIDNNQNPQFKSANYIASLNKPLSPDTLGAQASHITYEPNIVIAAYKGNEKRKSELHLQWNQRQEKTSLTGLTIWASSQVDGSLTSLGSVSLLENGRTLNKEEWSTIKNSAELMIIEGNHSDGTVRFRGPCLQLKTWQVSGPNNASF
ncbi:hypothetical protein [Marinomonas mediterranea]|jgi:Uncharacterized protein conserved in bacteria|uniref:Uncharacterized protein n=1 Tax=Marinomonas mediterranea (strain ATCC 700492 / JCM 21426 / NBRC 103028 / MMB-1) TaxID=717774 RepID=F2JXW2_MARM1|nr:hypothetical protein [Marinomonas mediterranea]ADZ89611.1 hypothetical protein Marme_0308 [Marinomonas mediterranea MMB-1]WCN07703.1 hypothetical protein GV055_01575 [Marinomonas mediterranea]WCN15853.1 hypothetical protein GV053_01565 [Marinomonas mediterranea MMB-1]